MRTSSIYYALAIILACPLASAQWIQTNGPYGGPVNALAVRGTNLLAGVFYAGVWKRPLSEMITDIEGGEGLTTSFGLEQNYPNPFNPSTRIQYAIPSRSHVTLTVYNTLGQIVRVLVNGEMEAGYHDVQFDATGLSSGVYFYRMNARDFLETKRLLLLH